MPLFFYRFFFSSTSGHWALNTMTTNCDPMRVKVFTYWSRVILMMTDVIHGEGWVTWRTTRFLLKTLFCQSFCTMAQEAHSPVYFSQSSFIFSQSSFISLQSGFISSQSSFFFSQSRFIFSQSSFICPQSSFIFLTVQFYFFHSPVLILI